MNKHSRKLKKLERLLEMQQRSYALLKWMAQAVSGGFVDFHTAHKYSTLPEAAEGWIRGHFLNIPDDARPHEEDLHEFCLFFSTYLTNSFDLIVDPGKQLYSPGAHCFCPICSWLVDAPNLKTKKVRSTDKRRARIMKGDALRALAIERRLPLTDESVEALLDDPEWGEDISLLAYSYDLPHRANGIANGPAVLALWRGFAWTIEGSPKKNFQLTAQMMLEAEQRLHDKVAATESERD